jgi:seryl-tRNA synthetase
MLDVQTLRDHPDRVRQAMRDKGAGDPELVDRVLAVDEQRRAAQTELQEAQTELNASSKQIGQLMGQGKRDEAQALIQRTSELKQRVKELEDEPKRLDDEQHRLMLEIPNLPHPSVPVGATPDDNEVAFEWGEKPTFDFEPKPHWELAEQHGLIDFERGAKVAGAGFPFYLGQGARLQRALVQFFLDLAGEAGYTEMQPPLLVNEASGVGTGQIPDKEGMMYSTYGNDLLGGSGEEAAQRAEKLRLAASMLRTEEPSQVGPLSSDDLAREMDRMATSMDQVADTTRFFLIPTAEVPVTNFFRDEIRDADALPTKYAAYTPCFRREAGSYGKDVRGLNRLHQFDKVELVQFVHPDESYDALEQLREDAERAVQKLGLPYQRLLMCTGDMGVTQSKKYDLEVWSAGQSRWLEVSSVSNFEAYQARRANIRFRPEGGGKTQFVHTLNGSGLALPRIVAALLENNQQADGSILIPEALRPYTGFDQIG